MNPEKRQRVHTSMNEKLQALKDLSEGKSLYDVADKLGVHYDTVRTWKKNRNKIERWSAVNKKRVDIVKCATMRTTENEHLSDAVFTWFDMERKRGVPISGPMIRQKALHYHELLGRTDKFFASEGWLSRFKQKYGIRQLGMSLEKLSADDSAVEPLKNNLLKVVKEEQLSRDQIFNCDETGINYKMMPLKSPAAEIEREAPGFANDEDRVTAMACSNASGFLKLPLMLIGKSAEPNLKMDNLPVFYRHQKSAWMTSKLFKEWFDKEFVPRVSSFLSERGLPQKALLLVDDAPSHKLDCAQEGIKIMFLPPNMTALVQPMEQGVLENLKRRYRSEIMTSIGDSVEDGTTLIQRLKMITMKDVIFWLAESWKGVSSITLQRSWLKILPEHESGKNSQETPVLEHNEAVDEQDIQQCLTEMDDPMKIFPDTEIIAMTMDTIKEDENVENYYKENTRFSDKIIKPIEAMNAAQTLIEYFQNKENFPPDELLMLHHCKNRAMLDTVRCNNG